MPVEHADRGGRIVLLVGVTKCPHAPTGSMPGSPESLSRVAPKPGREGVKYARRMSCARGEALPLRVTLLHISLS